VSTQRVATLSLPRLDGTLAPHTVGEPRAFPRPSAPLESRVFLAAAHVVADPLAEPDGTGRARLDWEATLAFREHLWSWGLGVAEAMDTAQRGMGLDWETSRELIALSAAAARISNGRLACGAGTDQLAPGSHPLEAIADAYLEQCAYVEGHGAQVIVMASRSLAASASGADDYRTVYDVVLSRLARPAILHWLGEMFDPALRGYWGSNDLDEATDAVVDLITSHAAKVDGIKVSLLDADRERDLRERLPVGCRLYTGDDFNYPELILGDGDDGRASDALLGIFDAIAPAASAALQALDAGDVEAYEDWFAPTIALARHVFSAPTPAYKTGIVFLAWLNLHQTHFRMVGGLESARSLAHLGETFVLADRAGLLTDPERAADRMRRLLLVAGVT
jgi:Protein of unknown function (DUF993)